jgi:tRNA (adenine57-N1/adenine58-N1)-methyltransferase
MVIEFNKLKRGPQVILPKDAALILAYSSISSGQKVLDAGTGSGWLAIFLARLVYPGEVYTYEKRKEFYKLARKNIDILGLKNIKLFNADIKKAKIKEKFDLITLDLKQPYKLIKKLDKNLKKRGTFVIYSPNIEQIKECVEIFEKLGYQTKTFENIVREWQVGFSTHPIHSGVLHTGFICFGYKGYIKKKK